MKRESLASAIACFQGVTLLEEEALCLNLRGRTETCQRCTDVCTANALKLSVDAVDVITEDCSACGACVPACPAGVLRLSGFSPQRFLKALGNEPEVHLHCSRSSDNGGGIVIPCYQVLDARLLAAARAQGVVSVLLHGLDACKRCDKGDAMKAVVGMSRQLNAWLGETAPLVRPAPSEVVAETPRQHEDQQQMSRRSFLRFAGARAATGATEWLAPVEDEDDEALELPFYQGNPEDYHRAHPYQALLAENAVGLSWLKEGELPWQLRTLSDDCSACLACGQHCPTGALLAVEDTQARSISFEPALCTDCSLCTSVCPMDAVVVHPAHQLVDVLASRRVLMMRHQDQCEHCGNPFMPEQVEENHLCPTCRNEQDLDDEWVSMLEG